MYDLLIRADAGGALGTGHVMRMIALAQAWQDRGGRAVLAACECPTALVDRIHAEGIGFLALNADELGGDEDLRETAMAAERMAVKCIALDGYHFNTPFQTALRKKGYRLLAVDDYGHCESWDADLVLNQNIQMSEPEPREGFLDGPQFALLRREFRAPPSVPRSFVSSTAIKLLVTFGGVDPAGATNRILHALRSVDIPHLSVTVLAGSANKRLSELEEEAAASPHQCKLIANSDHMAALYQSMDRVISAGGSSCYEWMWAGIPGWVTSVAENQDAIVRAMLARQLAAGMKRIDDVSNEQLSTSLKAWLLESAPPLENPRVDGYGACKVAAALSGDGCWIRPVDKETDAKFLYELANDPIVRSVGHYPENIPWNDHIAWLSKHSSSLDSHLMIIETIRRGRIGQIRFHRRENEIWEIGISISPSGRKLGLGASALRLAMQRLVSTENVRSWLAEIRPENLPSQRLFAKLGFGLEHQSGDRQHWMLHNSSTIRPS